MKILIPLLGKGRRFKEAGYALPKPLIDVCGKSMIDRVIDNFGRDNHFIFVTDDSISPFLQGTIVWGHHTGGAACSCLLASEYINEEPLIIANCDQIVDINPLIDYEGDGCILTFKANHPKWSYARIHNNRVIEVAEKKPISEHATVGVYYLKNGLDFLEGAKRMIKKGITTNGEFYVAPVYNELVLMGKDIRIHEILPEQMHGMGTPEDLKEYEAYLSK